MITQNPEITELKQKTVKSLSVMLIREFSMKILAFFGQLVLFRILTPKDFGVFAMIAFIVSFFELFSDIGLTSAIIQQKSQPSDASLSTVFFLKQLLGILCIIIIYSISPYLHLLYKDFNQANVQMVRILALTLLLKPLRTFLTAILERELRYDIISFIDVLGVISYEIAAISFALLKFSIWSFVLAILVKESLEFITILFYAKWKPVLKIQRKELKKLIKFGVYIQAQGLLLFLHDALNPIIVGSRIGAYQVGLVNFATGITSVSKQITDNYSRVAFASFSRFQDNKTERIKTINQSTIYLSIFAFYFGLIVFGLGRDITHFIFTDKWLPAMQAVYIMTITVMLIALYTPIIAALMAMGKSKAISQMIAIATIIEWSISITCIGKVGFIAIPIAGLCAMLFSVLWSFYTLKIVEIWQAFLKIILKKSIHIFLIIILLHLINFFIPNTLLTLIVKGIIITAIYIGFLYLFSKKEFKQLLLIILRVSQSSD